MTTPTPDVDPALVELLAAHQRRVTAGGPCWCGEWPRRSDRNATYMAHLAAVLEPHIQQRVRDALEDAAVAVEAWGREPWGSKPGGNRYPRTPDAAARIVREAKP